MAANVNVAVADRSARSGLVRQAAWLLLAALLLWAVLVGFGQLLGHPLSNSGLVRADGSVDRWLARHRSPGWNDVTQVATLGAQTFTVIALGLVAFCALRWRLGRWRESMFLAVALIGEVSIFVCTTLMVDRQRPAVPHLDSAPPTSSFPSGHTAASVTLYGGLAVLAWYAGHQGWLRTVATVLAIVMPLAVAGSRLYRGMHYPTDVLAGALLAICWLAVCRRVILLDGRPK